MRNVSLRESTVEVCGGGDWAVSARASRSLGKAGSILFTGLSLNRWRAVSDDLHNTKGVA